MIMTIASNKELARVYLEARLLRCPFGGNPEACPLHDIRKKPIADRYDWLAKKSDEEVLEIFKQHTQFVTKTLQDW